MTNEEKYQAVRAIMKDYAKLADKMLVDLPKPITSDELFGQIVAPLGSLEVLEKHFSKKEQTGAVIVAKMHAAGELAFLDAVTQPERKAKHGAIREQIRRRT